MHSVGFLYITSENVSNKDVIILKECQPGALYKQFLIRRWSLEAQQPDKTTVLDNVREQFVSR